MPEGDTIHNAAQPHARRARRASRSSRSRRPSPAIARTAGPSGWTAARVRAVDAHGKHLFLRFEGDLTLHSHLRMSGAVGRLPARPALAPLARAAPGS